MRPRSLERRPLAAAALALFLAGASFLAAALLLDVRVALYLRSVDSVSNRRLAMAAGAAASALLLAGSFFAGRAWQRRFGVPHWAFPSLFAVFGPVIAVLGAASFFLPVAWPHWIDGELVGAAAVHFGGMLSLLFAPSFLADRRSRPRIVARSVFALWGVLLVCAGTAAALFLE